ncbi:MAG: Mur ligase family protein [Patescibacteria group bacterium]
MNSLFRKIIQFLLKWPAKFYLWRTKSYVLVIAGTTGRHWMKEEIVGVLLEKGLNARGNRKNFNAEIGLPLSILNLPSGEGSFWGWLRVIWLALLLSLRLSVVRNVPQYLVLEMAIDKPDNMNYLLSIVKPQAAVITTITMIYQENFEDLDEIAEEYKKLVQVLPTNGLLILNNDDKRVKGLFTFTNAETITYGLDDADFVAKNVKKLPDGQSFEIHRAHISRDTLFRHLASRSKHETSVSKIKIPRFGEHHVYAALVKEIVKERVIIIL